MGFIVQQIALVHWREQEFVWLLCSTKSCSRDELVGLLCSLMKICFPERFMTFVRALLLNKL